MNQTKKKEKNKNKNILQNPNQSQNQNQGLEAEKNLKPGTLMPCMDQVLIITLMLVMATIMAIAILIGMLMMIPPIEIEIEIARETGIEDSEVKEFNKSMNLTMMPYKKMKHIERLKFVLSFNE